MAGKLTDKTREKHKMGVQGLCLRINWATRVCYSIDETEAKSLNKQNKVQSKKWNFGAPPPIPLHTYKRIEIIYSTIYIIFADKYIFNKGFQ